MTHLGLGPSLEGPWGGLVGGVLVVVLSYREIALFSWEDWVTLCLLECLVPCLMGLFWMLDCPVWMGGLPPSLVGGRAVGGWLPSPGRAAGGAASNQ